MAGVAGQRARDRRLERRRAGLAALRDADVDGMREELDGDPRADHAAVQRQLLLPHAAASRMRSAKRRGARRWRRISPSTASIRTPFRPDPGGCPSAHEAADVLEEFRPRGRQLPFRPALGRSAGARARPGARRSCRRRRRSTRRAGSRRAASMRSSRRASRRADIAACSCRTISTRRSARSRWCRRSSRAVRVPVIAAGGIADAKGVAAAMALGAAGVQVGTAYLLCPEATTSAAASRGAEERRGAAHGAHQCVHRAARARHRQPPDPRAGTDQRCRPRVSAGGAGHRAAAGQGRKRRAAAISRRCGRGRTRADARRFRPAP